MFIRQEQQRLVATAVSHRLYTRQYPMNHVPLQTDKELLRARAMHLLWGIELLGVRFMLGLSSLVWAVLLVWPSSTTLFPTEAQVLAGVGRTNYAVMAMLATQGQWAAMFGLQGAVAFYALLYNVRTKLVLWAEACLGCLLWTAATIACFGAHFEEWETYAPPAALAPELVLSVGAWWVLVRYKVQHEDD